MAVKWVCVYKQLSNLQAHVVILDLAMLGHHVLMRAVTLTVLATSSKQEILMVLRNLKAY